MNEYFIKVENANLYYPSITYNATTLKDEIFRKLKLKSNKKILYDVHALKNLSLEVKEGERLGIIGLNGSGKSTLLKAMAGLYPLQSGSISTYGSIRAMLELNLGFEFEATGRENIMYRGLLLGETPKIVRQKEQEIIDFADIGEFIEYPIKAYSAGMLIRLAFAISTTIGGDIMLLDELIGAGDASFFQKAKARMVDLIDNSKIMVLVSHDLGSIKELCNRVIMMEKGIIVADGEPEVIIDFYLKHIGVR